MFAPILTGLIVTLLVGCGDSGGPRIKGTGAGSKTFVTTGTTGYLSDITPQDTGYEGGIPYTISGWQELHERQMEKMTNDLDILLAQRIQNIFIELVESPKRALKVIVKLKADGAEPESQQEFLAPIDRDEVTLIYANRKKGEPKGDIRYAVGGECNDNDCSVVDLWLKKYEKQKSGDYTLAAKAGMVYSVQKSNVAYQLPTDADKSASPQLQALIDLIDKGVYAIKQNYVVTHGPSFTRVTVPEAAPAPQPDSAQSADSAAPQNQAALEFTTPLLATNRKGISIPDFQIQGKTSEGVTAELEGNNPQTGSIWVDIAAQGATTESPDNSAESPAAALRLKFTATQQSSHSPPSAGEESGSTPDVAQRVEDEALLLYKDAVIPVFMDPEKQPFATAIHSELNSTYNSLHPRIAQHIKYWQGTETYHTCEDPQKAVRGQRRASATNFFTYTQPLIPTLHAAFRLVDITPEVAYLMAVESKYPYSEEYPIQVNAGPNATDSGPYQITNLTMQDILQRHAGFLEENNIVIKYNKPLGKGAYKSLTQDDSRRYLYESSILAGLYMKDLFGWFESDPALAVLGYTEGMGNTALFKSCAEQTIEHHQRACMEMTKHRRLSTMRANAFAVCAELNGQQKTACDQYVQSIHTPGTAFRKHETFKTSFDDIDRMNMAPCSKIAYVWEVLSLRVIGANPERYGFPRPRIEQRAEGTTEGFIRAKMIAPDNHHTHGGRIVEI
jgi:hypothetical protein